MSAEILHTKRYALFGSVAVVSYLLSNRAAVRNRMSKEHVGKLSKYKIKKQIGKGSYGTVFLVDCRESKKQVSGCQVIV